MADTSPLVVGYWNIRGLAAPLRMICSYAGADFHSAEYEVLAKPDGDWDRSQWYNEKPKLKALNPLINLPYVLERASDGSVVLVTQSNACLLFLGRKFGLNGKNDDEVRRNEQCLCQVMDLRDNLILLSYSKRDVFESVLPRYISDNMSVHLDKFEAWLEFYDSPFLGTRNSERELSPCESRITRER